MKISTVPMALTEGEPPWYHEIVPENGTWVERWVQYEEGDEPEDEPEEEPPKSAWIHRADMDYKDKNGVVHFHGMCGNCGFVHDFIDCHTGQYKYCPQCGQAMKWEAEDEQARAQGGE